MNRSRDTTFQSCQFPYERGESCPFYAATQIVLCGQTDFFCHWVERKRGLVQFESHDCLDTSQSYVTIMWSGHARLVSHPDRFSCVLGGGLFPHPKHRKKRSGHKINARLTQIMEFSKCHILRPMICLKLE